MTRLKRVGQPRSAGVQSQATSTSPTSQPLRLAYISIVIAVHAASDAASISCGLGPVSSPPLSVGSSMVSWWSRIRMTWRRLPERVAVAFMSSMMANALRERVEHQSSRPLRVEERGLRRHVDAGGRDLLDLADRAAPQEEGAVVLLGLHERQRLVVGARVAEAVEVGDVVLGHAEHALEDQRLEDRGAKVPVGLGVVGQRRVGANPILEHQP